MVSPVYLQIWRKDQPVAGKYKNPVAAGAMPGFPVAVTHLLEEVDTAMVLLVLIPVGEVLLVLNVAGVAYQVFAWIVVALAFEVFAWAAAALAFQVFLTGDVVAVVRKGVAVAYQVCASVVAGVAFQVAVAEQLHPVVKLVVAEGSLLVWEVAAVEWAL